MKLWNLMLAHPVIVSIVAAIVGAIFASPKLSAALGGLFGKLTNKPTPQPDILQWIPTDTDKHPIPSDAWQYEPKIDDAPKTDAEQRVLMFSWLDRMRTYALDEKNPKAVASANQLLNDLFTNEGDSHEPPNASPTATSS